MRVRLTLIALSFVVSLVCVVALVTAAPTAYADDGCAATYTVQRGDWLWNIARRHNTTYPELIRLNPWLGAHPNLIFPGQVLCLPSALAEEVIEVTPSAPAKKVVIEVTYTYTPTQDEDSVIFARGWRIGKRIHYPIEPAVDAIDTFGTTEEIAQAINSKPAPVLLGIRNEENDTTYSLVAIGSPSILSSLRISETEGVTITPGCNATPVQNALGGANVKNVEITMWLEAANGLGYPFQVTKLNQMPDSNVADSCYGSKPVAFVLLPATSGHADQYRIVMLLTEEGLGPPGRNWVTRCRAWGRSYGWFYRWLRSWYGC